MRETARRWLAAGAAAGAALVLVAAAPAEPDAAPKRPYATTETRAPCDAYTPQRRAFFGDLHVHTAYSFDAATQDTRDTPRDAYRFARGAPMGIQPYDDAGRALRTVQLARPLDFMAVTDHSELLGEVQLCTTPGSPGYDSWVCWIDRTFPNLAFQLLAARSLVWHSRWGFCGDAGKLCLSAAAGVWQHIRDAAEEAYDRSPACRFTSFVGYEYTATVGKGQNLHRNVIFRNDRVPPLPISWVETPNVMDLWRKLQAQCLDGIRGCDVLTIPHNSNLSGGLMFESATLTEPEDAGTPIGAEEARLRARWEPLIEIMQHKGSSECRVGAGTADEACGFENLPYDRFGAKFSWFVKKQKAAPSNFVRYALEKGLVLGARLGTNPFHFGFVGSTDTHIAAAGLTREKGHPGHGGAGAPAGEGVPKGFPDDIEYNPGGLAVLWAEENTRDALFAAMRRREAYATSGTRPLVRFFGGWDYPGDLCSSDHFAEQGYAGGVPMGGDLPAPPDRADAAPRFAVWALRDPGSGPGRGAPLQRVQIVKGWIDEGTVREKVLGVAGGADGASVDLATCEPRSTGHDSLCSVWTDPDFDPGVPAFYYARVLEDPTCRWSQYVCNEAKVDCSKPDSVPEALAACCSEDHHGAIQERAWTSPIWFTP